MKGQYVKKIISACVCGVVVLFCVTGVYLKTKNVGNKEDLEKYIKEEKENQNDVKTEIEDSQQEESEDGERIQPLDIEAPNQDDYETLWDYEKAIANYETGFFEDGTAPRWAVDARARDYYVYPKFNEIKVGETFDCKKLLSKFTLNSIEFYDNISEFNIKSEDVHYSYREMFSKMVTENGDVVDLGGEDMALAMINITIDCYSKWPVTIDNGGWPVEVKDMGDYYALEDKLNNALFRKHNLSSTHRLLYLDKHQDDISDYFMMTIKGGERVTINLGLFVNKNDLDNAIVVYDDSFYRFSYFSKGQYFFKLK